jgi:putative phosphoribosyl transferase
MAEANKTASVEFDVVIPAHGARLEGVLALPSAPRGLVVFAHGSGSSRHSSRNQHVAQRLQAKELGTLLFDLLTAPEEAADRSTGHLRFDIGLLAARLSAAVDWCRLQTGTRTLPLGLFGASTGAAAALVVAARHPDIIQAVVSRGGRPDLAGAALRQTRAPTLLIVGGNDLQVLDLNLEASRLIPGIVDVRVIPGAGHLFEESGALDQVATAANVWFARYLRPSPHEAVPAS